MGKKYSVIIPAYNAEHTLPRCLNSLCSQIRDDIEIIVVNDGSTDETEEICQNYAQQYPQIRSFSKENGGVSSARNLGLDKASGEYVLFVDSDDYVSEDYFSVLDQRLTEKWDFLLFESKVYDGTSFTHRPITAEKARTQEETATLLSSALKRQMLNSPCNKAYKHSILEEFNIRFDTRLPIGEDKVFVVNFAAHASCAMFISKPIYVVSIENKNSLSRKQRENLCDHILLEHDLLFAAARESVNVDAYNKAISYSFYRSAYTVLAELNKYQLTKVERKTAIKEICTRYAQKKVRFFGGIKHWIISLPVRCRQMWLIELLLGMKN